VKTIEIITATVLSCVAWGHVTQSFRLLDHIAQNIGHFRSMKAWNHNFVVIIILIIYLFIYNTYFRSCQIFFSFDSFLKSTNFLVLKLCSGIYKWNNAPISKIINCVCRWIYFFPNYTLVASYQRATMLCDYQTRHIQTGTRIAQMIRNWRMY
jgi:hypothetical protein